MFAWEVESKFLKSLTIWLHRWRHSRSVGANKQISFLVNLGSWLKFEFPISIYWYTFSLFLNAFFTEVFIKNDLRD